MSSDSFNTWKDMIKACEEEFEKSVLKAQKVLISQLGVLSRPDQRRTHGMTDGKRHSKKTIWLNED